MNYETKTNGLNLRKPGIYLWNVGGDTYVGRAEHPASTITAYATKVQRLADGLPSHHKDGKYRGVYHRMLDASRNGEAISVTLLENCPGIELNARKRHWCDSLNPNLNVRG